MLGRQQPDLQPLKGDPESRLELDPSRALPTALTAADRATQGGGASPARESSVCTADPAQALNQAMQTRGALRINTGVVPVLPTPTPAWELTGEV